MPVSTDAAARTLRAAVRAALLAGAVATAMCGVRGPPKPPLAPSAQDGGSAP